VLCGTVLVCAAIAQQAEQPAGKPEVKITYLNVCTPAENDKKELVSALGRLPLKAKFTPDFEVSRGRSTNTEPPVAIAEAGLPGAVVASSEISNWVRVRREFPPESPFISVQYTLSTTGRGAIETLVFRARDPKDILQIALEARASAADPATMLKTNTPAERIRLERFGKSTVALARCPSANQSAYESVFRDGSAVLARYRDVLGVRRIVPADLRRLGAFSTSEPSGRAKTAKPKPEPGPQ
jgi:hypothetical protein